MRIMILAGLMLLLNCGCTKTDAGLTGGILKIVQGLSCTCAPYLDLYRWQGAQVFVFQYKGPACNWMPGFYKINGEPFSLPQGTSFDQFSQQGQFIKQVWRCGG